MVTKNHPMGVTVKITFLTLHTKTEQVSISNLWKRGLTDRFSVMHLDTEVF